MALDLSLYGASATGRPQSFPKTRPQSFPKEVEGFLLSRDVNGCSPYTLTGYRARLAKFFTLYPHAVDEVDSMAVSRFILGLRDAGYSSEYVNVHFRVLRTFFNWCVVEQFIDVSPMRNMKQGRLVRRRRPFITEEQRDRLLYLCPPRLFLGARDAALVWLFWSTGARRQEIARLELADLDWERNRIRVFGKGSKERFTVFTPKAKKAVWRYLSYRRDDMPCLWLTEERRPLTQGGMVTIMRRLMDRAGLRDELPGDLHHVFRRSWVRRLIQRGVSLKDIQMLGGWASMRMLELYVRDMMSDEAVERVGSRAD